MKILSSAFENNQPIPSKYTCQGENINPELKFEEVPKDSKSLSLIMDDPDATIGTFVHWVVFNMPSDITGIKENSTPIGIQAKNSAGKNTYIGPCPPSGVHRYYFKLFAVDTVLDAEKISTKEDLLAAMQGHILAEADLMGTYIKT